MGRLNGPTDHPTERPTERPTEKPPSTTRPGINIRNRFKKSHRIELRELHTQLEKLHASHLGTCIMAVKRRPEIATPCGQYSEFAATYRCLSNCSIPLTQSATAVFRFEAEPEGAQIPPPPPVSPWSPFFPLRSNFLFYLWSVRLSSRSSVSAGGGRRACPPASPSAMAASWRTASRSGSTHSPAASAASVPRQETSSTRRAARSESESPMGSQ